MAALFILGGLAMIASGDPQKVIFGGIFLAASPLWLS
jgi:hypothetical protein